MYRFLNRLRGLLIVSGLALVVVIWVFMLVAAGMVFVESIANGAEPDPYGARRTGQNAAGNALAQLEIAQRGNAVESVPAELGQNLDPPPSDAHKWFVTVIASHICPYCERLLDDIETSKYLTPYINLDDPSKSWAHFNLFYIEDETQQWRWKNIKITRYPTILVQPPRNGDFGNPATVVLQVDGYRGDPKALAKTLYYGIERYIEAQNPVEGIFPLRPRPRPEPVLPSPGPDQVDEPLQPPFNPPPAPNTPTPATPPPPPVVEPPANEPPPPPVVEPEAPEDMVLQGVLMILEGASSGTLTNILAAVVLTLVYRNGRGNQLKKVVDHYLEARAHVNRAQQPE